MGKRRRQSSSVDEVVSPAIIKRKSTRLTRSKKVKAESKAASPILIRSSPVSTRQHEAGPSHSRSTHQGRLSRRRRSNVHRLLDTDCTTPVRMKHGRNSLVASTPSPYSQSEPEITWDDKSPNAVQPRKLSKGGKRNAVEDISDIINCVPDIIVDNSNKKPSLLSLWMNRDSPSPKSTNQTNVDASRLPTKKKGGGKNSRKSRLSALTHELEKVLSVIEPVEEQTDVSTAAIEEAHCSSAVTSSANSVIKVGKSASQNNSKTMPTLLPQTPTKVSGSALVVDTKRTSPTLYTQTKQTQSNQCDNNIPLPALGHSPQSDKCKQSESSSSDENKDRHPRTNPPPVKEEQLGGKCDAANGSDESPPDSQSKWEAIGNASADDLWGDDDFFEDDDLLMGTIQVEIASSQMPKSTPVRNVKKRLSLKAAGAGPTKINAAVSSVKATAANGETHKSGSETVLSRNNQQHNALSTKQPEAFVAATNATNKMQTQTPTNIVSSGPNKTFSSSYPTHTKSENCDSDKTSLSQKVFIPHQSSSQTRRAGSAVVNQPQSACAPRGQVALEKAPTLVAYSLRSVGNATPASMSKTSPATHTTSTVSNSNQLTVPKETIINNVSRTMQQSVASLSQPSKPNIVARTLPSSTASQYIAAASTVYTRTNPPNVTRVVYSATPSTSAVTNPLVTMPSSQINKFVPSKTAVSQSKTISSVCTSTTSSVGYAKPSKQLTTSDSGSKLLSSKSYVPVQKVDASKMQNIAKKVQPVSTSQMGTINVSASQQTSNSSKPVSSKSYVPFQKVETSNKQYPAKKFQPVNALQKGTNNTTVSQQTKVYVPFSKQSLQPTTPTSGHGGYSQTTCKPNTTQSSKQYVPYKTLTNKAVANSTRCTTVSSNSSQSVSKYSASVTTQSVATGGCKPTSPTNAASITTPTIPSKTKTTELNQQKPLLPSTSSTSNKITWSGASKAFVPFKKPNNPKTDHPSSTAVSTAAYKPAITRSKSTFKFQPSTAKQNQTPTSQMSGNAIASGQTAVPVPNTKPEGFVRHNSSTLTASQTGNPSAAGRSQQPVTSAPLSKSKTFVKHTRSSAALSNCKTSGGTKSAGSVPNLMHTIGVQKNKCSINTSQNALGSRGMNAVSHSNTSKNLANSKYSNNNTSMHPPQSAKTKNLSASVTAEFDEFDDDLLLMTLEANNTGTTLPHSIKTKTKAPSSSAGCIRGSTIAVPAGTSLASKSSSTATAELEQFDDLLMMSLAADMDGSWDEC